MVRIVGTLIIAGALSHWPLAIQSQAQPVRLAYVSTPAMRAATAHRFPVGRSCDGSTLGGMDSLPPMYQNGRDDESVASIAKIVGAGNETVGWVYKSTRGRFFIQANGLMPLADQRASGVVVSFKGRSQRFVSGIKLLVTKPAWRDLRVFPCV